MKTLLLSAQILLLALGAHGENVFLHNASDLVSFSNDVNSGKDYTGTTVILDADIDFSGYSDVFVPIGKYTNNNTFGFKGVFDGQGHKISNLEMNSSSLDNVGFFGYSYKASIKNIVFDSSCSFTSTASGGDVATLGPISLFTGGDESCTIENIVNMAKITFTGQSTNFIIAGGIIGKLTSLSIVKSCANYGNITVSEGFINNTYIGGIAGEIIGEEEMTISIHHCVNYGSISNEKEGNDQEFLGGIVGQTQNLLSIKSCVNTGEITSKDGKSLVGGIVGNSLQPTTASSISDSFWTNDVNECNKIYQYEDSATQTNSEHVNEMNEAVLSALNGDSDSGSDGKWLLNNGGYTVTFYVNDREYFHSTSQIILIPSFEEERIAGNFSGWFTNASCTTLFISSTITESTDLYGIHNTLVTVSFDVNGGSLSHSSSSSSIVATYTAPYGELPIATRTEHVFLGWFTRITDGDKVEETTNVANPDSHTLYAHWAINNYTVFFNLTNGTVIESVFGYNEAIEYPSNESIEREGFIFDGWNSIIEVMPGANTTIEAIWTEIIPSSSPSSVFSSFVFVSEYVEIVFGKKDMSREEVEEFIRKYTDENAFTIEELKSDSGTVVIVKFEDTKRATSFIESIEASSASDEPITSINFYKTPLVEFSPSAYSHLFVYLSLVVLFTF